MPKLTLTKVGCAAQSVHDGDDEVYIMYQSDGDVLLRYPLTSHQKMNSDDKSDWDLPDGGLTIDFDTAVFISLWDEDLSYDIGSAGTKEINLNPPDLLGNIHFVPGSSSDSYEVHGTNAAVYYLYVTIDRSYQEDAV